MKLAQSFSVGMQLFEIIVGIIFLIAANDLNPEPIYIWGLITVILLVIYFISYNVRLFRDKMFKFKSMDYQNIVELICLLIMIGLSCSAPFVYKSMPDISGFVLIWFICMSSVFIIFSIFSIFVLILFIIIYMKN